MKRGITEFTLSPSVDKHNKMIYEDGVICTPGFTPLTVTTPPTLDGYVIQYQALPNTAHLARWGSRTGEYCQTGAPCMLSRLPHTRVIDIERSGKPLGAKIHPGRGHEITSARSRWRVQILSSQSVSQSVRQTIAALRDGSHTASAMSHPSTVFILKTSTSDGQLRPVRVSD